ncbi:hypothetical protein LTR84_004698 [Exophiala bonariae]|uniref:2-dehydropantoate 2-reductase n=1 Tax=Exophiala bonariae TaxID=1690606 RepID=A0AAV9NRQ3_9EURO|nr:hypothetical protein LTR84_004698 [Exophiala bonariae]
MSPPPRILIFGTGSIGAVYAWVLAQAVGESNVFAVCRSNYDIAKKQGFTINSGIFGDNLNVRPVIVRSAAEAAEISTTTSNNRDQVPIFDYVIITAKAIPSTPSIPSQIAPAISPQTTIVLIQNGIGIEQIYHDAFPENPILSCVVYLPATQTSPGTITHTEVEHLHIGTYPSNTKLSTSTSTTDSPPTPTSAAQNAASTFTSLIRAGHATATLHRDIQGERWTKLLVNASWNPMCALSRSRDAEILNSSPAHAPEVLRAVMLEVAAVARAAGYAHVSPERAEMQLGRARARALPGVEPSMLADVRGGRRMEVDAIVGNALRVAEGLGVHTPLLRLLFVLLNALERRVEDAEV